MTDRDIRRQTFISSMADHVLRAGLTGASLRPLAAAAGTSDRMLLYYFADKDELLTATLAEVSGRMIPLLEAAIDGTPRPFDTLLAEVGAVIRGVAIQPFMLLWLEMAAASGRGVEPYRTVAGQIADGFLSWIASRLRSEPGVDMHARAARLLAIIEGSAVLDAVGRGRAAEIALGRSRV